MKVTKIHQFQTELIFYAFADLTLHGNIAKFHEIKINFYACTSAHNEHNLQQFYQ